MPLALHRLKSRILYRYRRSPSAEVIYGLTHSCLHAHLQMVGTRSQSADFQLHSKSSSLCVAWGSECLRGINRQAAEQQRSALEACTYAAAAALHPLLPCEVLIDRIRDVVFQQWMPGDRMQPSLPSSCPLSQNYFTGPSWSRLSALASSVRPPLLPRGWFLAFCQGDKTIG